MINNINRGGLILTIALALIAGLVVFNTIRIAMYANREEIGIMRLVGANNKFIRGPYVVEGIIYGVVSGLFSLLVIYPAIIFTSPYISVLLPEINLKSYFTANLMSFMGYHLLFGIGLGIISSMIAIRRYLRT